MYKTTQKLLNTNRDNSMGATSKNDITGLFKTTSHLSRSLLERTTNEKTNANYYTKTNEQQQMTQPQQSRTKGFHDTKKSSLSSSGKMIMTKPPTLKETAIKNLTHNYTNVDNQEAVYEMFRVLKEDKRARHLDTLDSFDVWKENYYNQMDEKSNRHFEKLRKDLFNTKSHMNEQFEKPNEILVTYVYQDIDNVEEAYNKIFENRQVEIEFTRKQIKNIEKERVRVSENYISNLMKDLNDIGFILVGEVDDFIFSKRKTFKEFFERRAAENEKTFKDLNESEKVLFEEAHSNFAKFVKRWKDIKLKRFLDDTKTILESEDFVDNKERYEIIENLRKDQESIYSERLKLLNKQVTMNFEEITLKKVETLMNLLEDIYNKAQGFYDLHTQNLVDFSEKIFRNSMNEIEKFKAKVRTIKYEFGTTTGLDDLINDEIIPIVNKYKAERKDYSSKIIMYIDDYDDYTHNNCLRILRIFKELGKKNDTHKKNIHDKEKLYLIELAKEADNNDDSLSEKEEHLKNILLEMKSGIDKAEIDEKLTEAFKVIDELGVEYRDYFSKVDNLLSGHEGNLIDTFHTWEESILNIFSILSSSKKEEIEKKRQVEAEYLSYIKEQEIIAKEASEQPQVDAKGKPIKKKEAPKPKKGEVVPLLVPPKPIDGLKSPIGFDYIIDINYQEIANYMIRDICERKELVEENIISNIINFKSPIPQRPDSKAKLEVKGKGAAPKDKEKEEVSEVPELKTLIDNNPYKVLEKKEFHSPLSIKETKVLSEDCIFDFEYLASIFEGIVTSSLEKVSENLKNIIDSSKVTDNDRREDFLSELDIRLKSLAPRKGKIEVEDYDKRINEIEKHHEKYINHTKEILKRNDTDRDENQAKINEVQKDFEELNVLFGKLAKGMDEETVSKNLDEKFKKFKTSYYEFNLKIEELELKLHQYGVKNPENLLMLNENFILSLQTFEKGGTYSQKEKEFYEYQVNQINEETIKVQKQQRQKLNKEVIDKYKAAMAQELDRFEKKFKTMSEYIMAKDGVGKKFGVPRRLVHDIVINIRMKCNQAKEGLEVLFNQLKTLTGSNKKMSNDLKYLNTTNYIIEIKKIILAINNCVYNYGKYISGFREGFTYNLVRITLRENSEALELSGKEEIDEDDKRKIAEQENLGLLSKFLSSNISYDQEIAGIDDKVRNECAKIYVGDFAKLITTPEKILPALLPFIKATKLEMEKSRIVYIRDLRAFCGKLFSYAENLPLEIYTYLYNFHFMNYNAKQEEIFDVYRKSLAESTDVKEKLNRIIGPNLANPYYKEELESIIKREKDRSETILMQTNKRQLESIELAEKVGSDFYIRCVSNFEAFLILFDSFILEEDFITLEDDDTTVERKDYNFLMKLKTDYKPNLNLNNKKTYKKIYLGLDKNLLKVNYYEKFNTVVTKLVENNEEKIKALQESGKENLTKNITALKTLCNKQMFLKKNEFYEQYSKFFQSNVDSLIKYFDKIREEELIYQKRWDEIIDSLKNLKI